MTTTIKLDTFTRQYLETALWSSTDESDDRGGEPMDRNYGIEDIAPEAIAHAVIDCERFQAQAGDKILPDLETAAHDFWLTRNHHGAGFWDGDWKDGEFLTKLAHSFGETWLYVGDDGRIYCWGQP